MIRRCKDCVTEGAVNKRPAKHPGPRCTTHHRVAVKRAESLAHARAVENRYGISAGDYWTLYEAQGRHCAICQIATGKTKRLAVDHDHDTGQVRGLLCGPCNQLIGRRYGIEALARAINYLADPPAPKILMSHMLTREGTMG